MRLAASSAGSAPALEMSNLASFSSFFSPKVEDWEGHSRLQRTLSSRHHPRLSNSCRMASGALPAQPAAWGELEELQAMAAALQGTALQRQQEVVTARRSTADLGTQASSLNRRRPFCSWARVFSTRRFGDT